MQKIYGFCLKEEVFLNTLDVKTVPNVLLIGHVSL